MKKITFGLIALLLLFVACDNIIESRYNIAYDSNGADSGTVPESITSQVSLSEITVSDNTGGLVKDTFLFDGWNTKADGTGTDYIAGATLIVGIADIVLRDFPFDSVTVFKLRIKF